MHASSDHRDGQHRTDKHFDFFGEGGALFSILVVNFVFTFITLGLYYPWAKARTRKYLWSETEFARSAFSFTGTGKEMFRGFLLVYGVLIGIVLLSLILPYAIVLLLAFAALIVPLAIFGSWRYRITRTSWRGIHFTFDGNFSEFLNLFVIQFLLTLITFGIYGAWMRVKIQQYLFEHTRFGHLRMGFSGEGSNLFLINLSALLIYPTLGLYFPWFVKKRFNFTINNTYLEDDEQREYLHSYLDGSEAFKVIFVNALIIVFTLGLGYPWALVRKLKMYFENIELPEAFDYDSLQQQDQDMHSATGDEVADVFDVDLDF